MSSSPRCLTCKFFEQQNSQQGMCRRYPPTPFPVSEKQTVTIPTTVRVEEWCGEYRLGIITATSLPIEGANVN